MIQCILGSGSDYFDYVYHANPLSELVKAKREHDARLNSIVFYFQKKSFQHVR
jgi:hypothetical protein